MFSAGCIGTEVKSAETSKDVTFSQFECDLFDPINKVPSTLYVMGGFVH